jgi:hypothetical protein
MNDALTCSHAAQSKNPGPWQANCKAQQLSYQGVTAPLLPWLRHKAESRFCVKPETDVTCLALFAVEVLTALNSMATAASDPPALAAQEGEPFPGRGCHGRQLRAGAGPDVVGAPAR